MGKIFARLFVNTAKAITRGSSYPNISDISSITSALPGKTFIVRLEEEKNISTIIKCYKLDLENDNFCDGTEIVAKYRTITTLMGYETVFDGIEVIASIASTTTTQTNQNHLSGIVAQLNASLGSFIGGPKVYITPHNNYGGATTIDTGKENSSANSCVCGAEKVGGLHSSWCNKKN